MLKINPKIHEFMKQFFLEGSFVHIILQDLKTMKWRQHFVCKSLKITQNFQTSLELLYVRLFWENFIYMFSQYSYYYSIYMEYSFLKCSESVQLKGKFDNKCHKVQIYMNVIMVSPSNNGQVHILSYFPLIIGIFLP